MKIKPVLAGAAMLLGTTIGFAPHAGAEVGVVEDPYCYTMETNVGKEGTVTTITIYDADGDVVTSANTTQGTTYDKVKEQASSLGECKVAETPILDPAVALMGLGAAIPAGILVKRRRSAAAV